RLALVAQLPLRQLALRVVLHDFVLERGFAFLLNAFTSLQRGPIGVEVGNKLLMLLAFARPLPLPALPKALIDLVDAHAGLGDVLLLPGDLFLRFPEFLFELGELLVLLDLFLVQGLAFVLGEVGPKLDLTLSLLEMSGELLFLLLQIAATLFEASFLLL